MPSIMVCHSNTLPVSEVGTRNNVLPVPLPYKNSHATASRLASCIRNHNTSLHQWYTHNGHTTTRHLYRWHTQKSHARTCCLRQWYPQKQPCNNTLPPQVEDVVAIQELLQFALLHFALKKLLHFALESYYNSR